MKLRTFWSSSNPNVSGCPSFLCQLRYSYDIMYILLMINRTTIVNIQVALMILYLPKNERIVINKRAKLVTNEPTKNGLMSTKVNAFAE